MDFISDSFAEGFAEAKAEQSKLTTPISYWCKLFDFQYSPREFYALVEKNLDVREVPDLLKGFFLLHEGTVFSAKRLYLQMRRQRIIFEICAAPFGSGFFVSSRLFDRRRDARFLDYIIAAAILGGISVYSWMVLGFLPSIAVFGIVVTSIWSVMRLGVSLDAVQLDEQLSDIPCLGRIYESLFHPDTYFRQDQTSMYREAVHRAVMDSVAEMSTAKGIKPPPETEMRPILADLKRR